jgi:hypothetical protein
MNEPRPNRNPTSRPLPRSLNPEKSVRPPPAPDRQPTKPSQAVAFRSAVQAESPEQARRFAMPAEAVPAVPMSCAGWYFKIMGEVCGPISISDLRDKAAQGVVTLDTHIRIGENGDWMLAERVSGLFSSAGSMQSSLEREGNRDHEAEDSPPSDCTAAAVIRENRPSGQEEIVFFDHDGVLVTKTRFTVGTTTYALSGLVAVEQVEHEQVEPVAIPVASSAVVCTVLGGLLGLLGFAAWCVEIIPVGLGLIVLAATLIAAGLNRMPVFHEAKSLYTIIVITASGRQQAVTSHDKSHVSNIVAALNEAIIARG